MIERPGIRRRSLLKVDLARRAVLYVRWNEEMPPRPKAGVTQGF
jgi:hypothetical protein